MNREFYTLLFASLVFVACNTTQPTAKVLENKKSSIVESAKKEIVEQKSMLESVTKVAKKEAVTTIGGVKFVKKSIVQEQGLFHIKSFIGTLKPTLKSAMKDGGPTVGFGVCASIAMEMTNDYNALTTDTKVYRTALKYRNLKNKPDQTDTQVMNELIRKGDFKPVTIDAGDHYRVYKPLPSKAECLACHGDSSNISEKVSAMIKRKYPKDLAIDHIQGDFRGVVVAKITK
jgi:hypothetical protein